MSINITINPAYEELVPKVTDDEYRSLLESIKKDGLWYPIVINDIEIVLDGHTRLRACKELGIDPQYIEKVFENTLLERKFIIESNLKRRQLNDFQKSELGIPLLEIEKELAAQRQVDNTPSVGKSRDVVAKQIGVSGTIFERSKKIIAVAPENIKENLRAGKTTISKEYQKIRKDEKKHIRQEEIKEKQVNLPESVTLHNTDFQKTFIEGDSVSLIFTDPPYHEKYLYLYEDLAVHASRVLRDGGSLLCFVGHYAIGTIINVMEKHGLKFHWPIAVIHSGPSASVFGRKILVGYKPILWFTKGSYQGEFVRDVVCSEFQGKELHEWAQSTVESDYYIKYLTIENEIVYDPFMGQGTFGVSAVKQNRQFIGCEINAEHFENARRLISDAKL